MLSLELMIYLQIMASTVILCLFIIKFIDLFLIIKNTKSHYFFLAIMLIIKLIPQYFNINSEMMTYGLIILYCFIAYDGHVIKKLFVGLLGIGIYICSYYMSSYIVTIINNNFFYMSLYIDYLVSDILLIILLLIQYLLFKYADNDYRYSSFKDLLYFCMTYVLLDLGLYMVINYPIASDLRYINLYSFALIIILEIALMFIALLTRKLNQSKKELVQSEINKYETSLNETVKQNIEETYKNNRKLKHDMANHLLAIQLRIESGDNDEALKYIQQISQNISQTKVIHTDNDVLNYIVNSKIDHMQNIDFTYKIEDSLHNIDAYDLVTIIGNLLDNAIEAQQYVENNKKIHFQILIRDNTTIIKIKNTYNKMYLKIKNNQLYSNKNDKQNHGLGIENVKEAIHKYHGEYHLNIDDMYETTITFY